VTGYAAEEWRRIGPELHRLGLLTVADTSVFEGYCITYGRWRELEEQLAGAELTVPGSTGNQVINPLLKAAAQAARDVIRFSNEFGSAFAGEGLKVSSPITGELITMSGSTSP
jgi:P27 family predicted phage terminase small subunit